MTGLVFDIQKFSIHDGPGIRTTVFLKGCPLHCLWCPNPESVSPDPELSFIPGRCIKCGHCFQHCPEAAHQVEEGVHRVNRELCTVCGTCAEGCHAQGLEVIGRKMTVDEVIAEVLKDKAYFENSGGGMTLSGGEPLMQADFCEALLRRARRQELHTCIETSGFANYARIEQLRPLTDLFLFDLKETDPERHKQVTGVPLEPILKNLRRLHDTGASILLRLPTIPGLNDRLKHFQSVAQLSRELPGLRGVQLMPYHRMGDSKLERIGHADDSRIEAATPEAAEIDAWIASFAELGVTLVNQPAGTEERS